MKDFKKLTSAQVVHIAKLAHLPLSDHEIPTLTDELSQTTNYIDVLQELDTSTIKPTAQVNHKKNIFRGDIVEPSFTQSQALSPSKDSYQGFFKTSATIKK